MKKKIVLNFILMALCLICHNSLSAQTITNFAGNGSAGYSGDGGQATAAKLNAEWGIAFDNSGNLYIADRHNYVVRVVNTSGVISTFAGTGTAGSTGDGGPATAAELNFPDVVTVGNGYLYISDNSNYSVRQVSLSTGTLTTFAGTLGSSGTSGNGGLATAAKLEAPVGVSYYTALKQVFICDANGEIRMVDSSGNIQKVAATYSWGFGGDGGAATSSTCQMHEPEGIFVNPVDGSYYIGD